MDKIQPLALSEILPYCLASFRTAAAPNNHHPFSLGYVATMGLKSEPEGRLMVLRHFALNKLHTPKVGCCTLSFYTDVRMGKVKQLESNPHLSLCFWDANNGIQVRCSATAEVEQQTQRCLDLWNAMPAYSKLDYGHTIQPGNFMFAPHEAFPRRIVQKLKDKTLDDKDMVYAYTKFCIINCHVHSIQFLQLSTDTHIHRHALLQWSAQSGDLDAKWVS